MFISWIKYHGRSADLARALSMDAVFIEGGSGNPIRRYLRQWQRTRAAIRDARPGSIIVMQPPLPALLAVISSARGRQAQVIGDLHTGALEDPKWRWAAGTILRILKRRGFAIVTNAPLAERVRKAGVETVVLHDLIPSWPADLSETFDDATLADLTSETFVLVPLAYANDEPVDALLQAARAAPGVRWVLTGKAPARVREAAPSTIRFTGYVTNEDYARLVHRAAVIAALTTREFTMQRVGYEALGAGRALITGDTRTLRDYFGASALYVRPDAESIAQGAEQALANRDTLAAAMAELREAKVEEEREGLAQLRAAVQLNSDGR